MFGHYPSETPPQKVNSITVNIIAQQAAKDNQLAYVKKLLAEFPNINLFELQSQASFPVAFYIKETFGVSYWQPKIKSAQMKLAALYPQVTENKDTDDMESIKKDQRIVNLLKEINSLRESEKKFNEFAQKQDPARLRTQPSKCLIM